MASYAESRYLSGSPRPPVGGVLALKYDAQSGGCDLYCHSTARSLGYGYASKEGVKVTYVIFFLCL